MKSRIRMVHLFPSFSCNLKCSHCYVNSVDKKKVKHQQFSKKLFIKIIETLKYFDPEVVHLEGGEPMLYTDLYELIAKISNKDTLTLVTNGTLIDEEAVRKLANAGLKEIVVSMEGPNTAANSILRGSSFEKASTAIKLLGESKIFTYVSFTAHKANFEMLEEMAELCVNLGAQGLRIGNLLVAGRGDRISDLELNDGDLTLLLEKYLTLREKYGNFLNITLSLPGSFLKHARKSSQWGKFEYKFFPCDAGQTQISIGPGGEIFPCYNVVSSDHCSTGNILGKNMHDLGKSLNFEKRTIMEICPIACSGHLYIGKLKASV